MSASLPFAVEEGLEKYSYLDTLEPDQALQLRLLPPEGSSGVAASLPFAVEEGLEKKYSYLDTLEPDQAPQLTWHGGGRWCCRRAPRASPQGTWTPSLSLIRHRSSRRMGAAGGAAGGLLGRRREAPGHLL